jgi:hypothetical protein
MNAEQKKLENKIAAAVRTALLEPTTPARGIEAAAPIIEAVTSQIAPEIISATNNEPWFASRVTIGALAGLVGGSYGLVLDVLDGTLPTPESVTAQVVVIGGAALTLYGRWAARRPIGSAQ